MAYALLLALALPCVGNVWGDDIEETGEGITVGVVGAGLGGAATAYYIRRALPNATIIVLEKDTIGGRIRSVSFNGAAGIELGGSTWHSSHQQMNELCEELEIPTTTPLKRTDGSTSGPYGVWNGRDIVFKQSASDMRMVFNMIWRYGLSPLYTQRIVDEASDKLEEVNTLLASLTPWTSHEGLLRQLHLYDTSQQDLRTLLRNHGFNAAFMDEIIEGIVRNNYGQSLSGTNALAGLMALKSGSDELLSAKGGNIKIVEELLKRAQCEVVHEAKVVSLYRSNDWNNSKTVTIKYDKQGTEHTLRVDAAVLAAPADLAGIDILDSRRIRYHTRPNSYVLLHVTLVLCNGLSPHYFRLLKSESDPSLLLTMEEDVAAFNSLGLYRKGTPRTQAIYKILSREHLTEDLLDKMFINKTDVMRHTWHAFSEMKPSPNYPPLRFDDNIYYPTGFEKVLPIMEGTVMSAKNIVNMLLADVKDIKRIQMEVQERQAASEAQAGEETNEEAKEEEEGAKEEEAEDWYSYLSKFISEDEVEEEKPKPKPKPKQEAAEEPQAGSWYSYFVPQEEAPAPAPSPEPEPEPKAEPEASWFSALFDDAPEAEPEQQSVPEPEPEPEPVEDGAWSWLW